MSLQTHTRVRVSFHSYPDNGYDSNRSDPAPFKVIGFTSGKGFGEPAGEFTLRLKPTKQDAPSLLDLWNDPEGVWVKIEFLINGVAVDTVFGNIDSVREQSVREGSGARTVTFTVTGRDHGKVFAQTEMHINVYERGGALPAIAAYTIAHRSLQGKPHDFVRTLVREWIGNNEVADTQWVFPPSLYGGARFYDVLNLTTISDRTRGDAQDLNLFSPDQQGRKLWDAMQEYSNGVLNEMWTDLAPDPARAGTRAATDPVTGRPLAVRQLSGLKPALYLRERPFPTFVGGLMSNKWEHLPTHDVYPEDIRERDITKGGGANKHNFWFLEGDGLQSRSIGMHARIQEETGLPPGRPGNFPIYDIDNTRRYGLRRFSQSTKFLPITDSTLAEIVFAVSGDWLQMLHDWYVVAPFELSGTIQTTRALPWIRVGHRIREHTRTGALIIYYVENVDHSYSFSAQGATASTTLTLTRGEPEDRHFLREVYERLESSARTVGALENRAVGLEGAAAEAPPSQSEAVREAPDAEAADRAASEVDGISSTLVDGVHQFEPSVFSLPSSQQADPDMNHDGMMPEDDMTELPSHRTDVEEPRDLGSLDPVTITTDPLSGTPMGDDE